MLSNEIQLKIEVPHIPPTTMLRVRVKGQGRTCLWSSIGDIVVVYRGPHFFEGRLYGTGVVYRGPSRIDDFLSPIDDHMSPINDLYVPYKLP